MCDVAVCVYVYVYVCVCVCVCWCVWRALDRDEPRGSTSTIRNISACSTCLPASWLTDWLTDWLTPQAGRMWSPSHCHSKNPPKVYEEIKCVSAETFYGPFIFFFHVMKFNHIRQHCSIWIGIFITCCSDFNMRSNPTKDEGGKIVALKTKQPQKQTVWSEPYEPRAFVSVLQKKLQYFSWQVSFCQYSYTPRSFVHLRCNGPANSDHVFLAHTAPFVRTL